MPRTRRKDTQEYWDKKLAREGLTPDAGRLPRQLPLRDSESVICSKCIGIHTYEGDCGLSGFGGTPETGEEGLAELC